ncbi:DUF2235 domain-containing protein [Amycolatopsis sp. OK19-0408]|uniref:DUF2235 domain-containing protein n=1 Tax=Amycolatopsis iheyensis TaxID=2945988 RepID=A0A9X2SRM8_9PSEU|nr:DUF2235 domain-containing protein [Amycolatopsis iheyensis]MCR6490796.1 DUF2235 domain-containing protein [Amycolatopsis iheyensis]
MKRLVICCDGTWNSRSQPAPTNVVKVKDAVAATDPAGIEQNAYYHEGVGAGVGPVGRLAGGAFGWGLSANVQDAYRFVVKHYEPGDELFFFGFSRGAYTARSVVGFIRNCGVLRPEYVDLVSDAYRLYRDRDEETGPASPVAERFRAEHSHEDVTPIRFVGVWDTVGALGIPLSGGRLLNLLNRRWQFHDTQLTSTVQAAYQALAVDEHRKAFVPAVWQPSPAANGQVREQVWFAGAHSDVGGGYPDQALSGLALRWMTDRAEKCGLAFTPTAFAAFPPPDELGVLHDSLNAFYRLFGSAQRQLGRVDPPSEYASSCAEERHLRLQSRYAPPSLVRYLARVPRRIMPV